MNSLKLFVLVAALTTHYGVAYAEAPPPPAASETKPAVEEAQMTPEALLASLKYQKGKVTLPNGIATLNLPADFQYLGPEDAEKVLVDGWGNLPDSELPLGMIVPTKHDPLSAEGWGVVITYEEDGHVSEDDADKMNYDDMLKDLQKSTEESNKERLKAGSYTMKLIGWAEKPSYDKATHKFYWAKEYSSSDSDEHTLNYDIRVLGRKGVLVLSAVSNMSQLSTIKTEMPKVVAATDFTATNTYADFDSKTDNVAKYGLAALVAGGVAAKMGLFGKLLALLIAFKKVIIVGAIALFAGIGKFFKRKPN